MFGNRYTFNLPLNLIAAKLPLPQKNNHLKYTLKCDTSPRFTGDKTKEAEGQIGAVVAVPKWPVALCSYIMRFLLSHLQLCFLSHKNEAETAEAFAPSNAVSAEPTNL